jgi:cytoskeletal protein RodZ
MMGYGGFGMMGLFGPLTWLVVFIDLVLVGIWLWQQISKK